MKGIIKIGSLGLCLVCSLTALLICSATEDSGQVALTLTEGSNSCILDDYLFQEKQASPSDQITDSLGQTIFCSFLRNSANEVSIIMSNLSNTGGVTIPASGFSGYITSGYTLGTISPLGDKTLQPLNIQQIIYEKSGNTIGEWSGNLIIQGVIPGGTPAGLYTGRIDLILQVK